MYIKLSFFKVLVAKESQVSAKWTAATTSPWFEISPEPDKETNLESAWSFEWKIQEYKIQWI